MRGQAFQMHCPPPVCLVPLSKGQRWGLASLSPLGMEVGWIGCGVLLNDLPVF